ncbi:MAG TPA: hypothetical protein VFN75_12165 [Pseudonocardiaceae bacterium]|nr:hypothetical protein [Pseudonocardiaceae bacterium]
MVPSSWQPGGPIKVARSDNDPLLVAEVRRFSADTDLRVLVVGVAGRACCSGGAADEMAAPLADPPWQTWQRMRRSLQALIRAVWDLDEEVEMTFAQGMDTGANCIDRSAATSDHAEAIAASKNAANPTSPAAEPAPHAPRGAIACFTSTAA